MWGGGGGEGGGNGTTTTIRTLDQFHPNFHYWLVNTSTYTGTGWEEALNCEAKPCFSDISFCAFYMKRVLLQWMPWTVLCLKWNNLKCPPAYDVFSLFIAPPALLSCLTLVPSCLVFLSYLWQFQMFHFFLTDHERHGPGKVDEKAQTCDSGKSHGDN